MTDVITQRTWLANQLVIAAEQVGATIAGRHVFGWHDRTIGAQADTPDGPRWLRVISEHQRWSSGDMWTGNVDAAHCAALASVPKPALLTVREWPVGEQQVRAELMTYVPDMPIADDMILRSPVNLPSAWWTTLDSALKAVTAVRTKRVIIGDDVLRYSLLAAFGIDPDLNRLEWACAHGDLHWSNLTAPTLWLLDWEHWGWAPRGYDAAILYCASILLPHLASQVHDQFAGQLDSYSGRVAQLAAITKLLCRVEDGEHLDLARPLHQHAAALLRHLQQN